MPEIRLIASDLDGTLLQKDGRLSETTRRVLQQCRDRGVLFFPVTARPPRALENWIPGLEYDGALCHNGGVALLHGEIVWERGIEPEAAGPLLRKLAERLPGAALSAEIGGLLYANFPADELWEGIDYIPTDFSENPKGPSEKLMVRLQSPEQLETVRALLPDTLTPQVSENTLIMIQPRDVSKGAGLLALCEKLSIPAEETVAFGDDWNDVSLLRAAGIGIAVANALPQIKSAADGLCLSNEEDGPARWLREHLHLPEPCVSLP